MKKSERKNMAYDKNIRNRFIEMCGKGISMSEISRKLNISLPTLDKWKEETKYEVFEFQRILKIEEEIESNRMITERVKILNNELERAYKSLEKRKLNNFKIKNLLYLLDKLENEFDDPLLAGRRKPEKKSIFKVNEINQATKEIKTSIKEE